MAVRANSLTGSAWLKNSFSIWRGFGRDSDSRDHPAPFPVAMVSQLIDCFVADKSAPLLDIYAGSGSALIAALESGMDCIGIDLNDEFKNIFEKRVSDRGLTGTSHFHVDDTRNLRKLIADNTVEICVTSPPYWDILNQKRTVDQKKSEGYSSDTRDLGNFENYEKFIKASSNHLASVEKVLKPGCYLIVNVMDLRKKSTFYSLHSDLTSAILSKSTLTLEDIIVWDRQSDYNSMRPLGYPYKFIVNKVHEYLLIFRKRR